MKTFAQVGLERPQYNEFRKEGFNNAQIVDSAKDVKALHWHGEERIKIAQHASPEIRKAAVATEQAKTEDQRKKRQAHEDDLERKNEARSDSDPQKANNRRFFRQRREDHLKNSQQAGIRSESRKHDSAAKPSAEDQRAQNTLIIKGGKQKTAALSSTADSLFGPSTPDMSKKTAPTKTASAKQVAGSKPT